MIITQILQGLKRLIFGSTYRFNTKKGSTSLKGSSWTEIYHEMSETPLKLISVEFVAEDVPIEYRIVVNGEKIFPFSDFSNMQIGKTMNFLMPIEIAAAEYLQIEVRSGINNTNVVIMKELAVIEVR